MLLCVHSSIAIILMGKRELFSLLNLSSWCLVMVERLFLAVTWGCLQFVIVVFPDHTHLLFSNQTLVTIVGTIVRFEVRLIQTFHIINKLGQLWPFYQQLNSHVEKNQKYAKVPSHYRKNTA